MKRLSSQVPALLRWQREYVPVGESDNMILT